MTRRPRLVTDTDVALLRSLGHARSVVAASRSVGISRDVATYRLGRLERAFGGPVVAGVRGGRTHGGTSLTPLGDRIVRGGFDSVELLESRPVVPSSHPNRFEGVYRRSPAPEVTLARGLHLRVAFAAEEGERVALLLDPESVLLARHRFVSSARNVLPGTVDRLETSPSGPMLVVRASSVAVRVAVTEETVRQLRLRPRTRVWLYVKATALRRVGPVRVRPIRGSLPSRGRRRPPPPGGSESR